VIVAAVEALLVAPIGFDAGRFVCRISVRHPRTKILHIACALLTLLQAENAGMS
jgi:hypothetical protein